MATLDFFESFSGYERMTDVNSSDSLTYTPLSDVPTPGLGHFQIVRDANSRFPGDPYIEGTNHGIFAAAGSRLKLGSRLRLLTPASATREYVVGFAFNATFTAQNEIVNPATSAFNNCVGFMLRQPQSTSGQINSSNTVSFYLTKNISSGANFLGISFVSNNGGTQVSVLNQFSSGDDIENNADNYYEFYIKMGSSIGTGLVRLYKNGNLILTLPVSFTNIISEFPTTGDIAVLPAYSKALVSDVLRMSDFYVARADGDSWTQFSNKRIARIKPNGPGTHTELTPSNGVGPNWEMVNKEFMADNTAFNFTNANEKQDSYTLSDMSFVPEAIHGVKVQTSVENPGSGSIYYQSVLIDSNGSRESIKTEVPHTVGIRQQIFEKDSQGNIWTKEDIDNLQSGIKVSTSLG